MRALAAAALLLLPASLMAQGKQQDLPSLMTNRAIGSLPAASPAETISYGEDPAQKIELFLPRSASETPRPVVILIHGQCWGQGSNPAILRPMAGALTDAGYAVWSVGYRPVGGEGSGYPAIYQDIATAVDHLRDIAADKGLDATQVVVAGHAGGGQLALWAAGRPNIAPESPLYRDNPLKPRGVVGLGSYTSFESPALARHCGAENVALMASAEQLAETSPEKLLPYRVPVVMLHGIYDDVSYPAVGLDFVRQARAKGTRADVQLAPVSGHYEVIAPGRPAFAQGIAAIKQLLPLP